MTDIYIKDKVFKVKNCPCCNHKPLDELDFFHPVDKNKRMFTMNCLSHEGGCGLQVFGNNEIETLNIWNNPEKRSNSMCCFFCNHQLTKYDIVEDKICWSDSVIEDLRVYGSEKDFEGKEYKHCFKITCPNCQSTMLQDDIAEIEKYFN